MAVTVTEVYNSCDKERDGNRGLDMAVVTVNITNDDFPVTEGGEPIDFTSSTILDKPFGTVHAVICDMEDGYLFNYDHSTSRLQARYFDNDAGADGAAISVPNLHDLSGISALRMTVFGVRASIS